MKEKYKLIVAVPMLVLGFTGSIFFFPFNFDNRFTCLYHRIFASDHAIAQAPLGPFTQGIEEDSLITSKSLPEPVDTADSEIVNQYVRSFGLMWWASLALLAAGFYRWNKRRTQTRNLDAMRNLSI